MAAVRPAFAIDLALNKPYKYEPAATYELTSDPRDAVKLTDGRYAQGYFWKSQAATVGWAQSGVIQITVDLLAPHAFSGVCINTARGEMAGVSFPLRADVFSSLDDRKYSYVGNVMQGDYHDSGPYLVKKFCLDNSPLVSRYVKLFIQPYGGFVFLDEIEINSASDIAQSGELYSNNAFMDERRISIFQVELVKNGQQLRALNWMARRLKSKLTSAYYGTVAGASRTGIAIDNILGSINSDSGCISPSCSIDDIRGELFEAHRHILSSLYKKPMIVWPNNPWDVFSPVDSPMSARLLDESLTLDLMREGTDSGAFAITNLTDQVQTYRLLTSYIRATSAAPTMLLREVVPVIFADGTERGDALIDLQNKQLVVKPGESKQIWVTASAHNVTAGNYPARIAISQPGAASLGELPVNVTVWPATFPKQQHLKVHIWSYPNWRPIKSSPQLAIDDLVAHHVNVFSLDTPQEPWPRVSADGRFLGADYRELDRFVRLIDGKGQMLFVLGQARLKQLGRKVMYPSQAWDRLVQAWIADWSRHLAKQGIGADRFAFYPVDEPQNDADIDCLYRFAKAVKAVDPGLRIYATVVSRLPSIKLLHALSMVDIVQAQPRALAWLNTGLIRDRRWQLWSYGTNGALKGTDPLSWYRAMPWQAFQSGLSGVGFWAYADTGPAGTAWDDMDGDRPDFSVIYEGRMGIVSSKRWEAWRQGVEDYELLWQVRVRQRSPLDESSLARTVDSVLSNWADYDKFLRLRRDLLAQASRR